MDGTNPAGETVSVKNQLLRITLFLLLLSGLAAAVLFLDLPQLLNSILAWIDRSGWFGIFIYVIVYIAACVFFIPGSLLTLGAGLLFGVFKGTAIVSLSSTLGATAAFLAGRYLARDFVARRIEKSPTFKSIDAAISDEGWKIVVLTRLSPIFPFNLLNYAFGVTRVSLRHYVIASWIGMLPATFLYVYIGSIAGSLAALGGSPDGRQRTSAEWILYSVGLAATLIVTVYITRLARAALKKRIDSKEAENG